MHVQSAPKSLSKLTIIIAARNDGGFWSSIRINLPSHEERRSDRGAVANADEKLSAALDWAQGQDEHYCSMDGGNITEAAAKKIVLEMAAWTVKD